MKLLSAPLLLSLAVVFALATTSCGKREEEATKIIVPDREVTNLRKPAQPVEIQYPLYPETAELGPDPQYFPKAERAPATPDRTVKSGGGNGSGSGSAGILESILNDPENAAAIEGAITSAMEQAPAILQGIMNQTGEGSSAELEEILSGGEIPPEAINQATELISEYAPALLEGIMSNSTEEGESSLGSAIAGMLFRKLLESGSSKEVTPNPGSSY